MIDFPAVSLPSVRQGKYYPCRVMHREGRDGMQTFDHKGLYVDERAVFRPDDKSFPVFSHAAGKLLGGRRRSTLMCPARLLYAALTKERLGRTSDACPGGADS